MSMSMSMSMYGYARVSSLSQSTDIQVARLKAAGCELVLDEAASGRSRAGRSELETILSFIRPGDTLVVVKLDRLGVQSRHLVDRV